MSIFKETFPTFVQNEITKRQNEILARSYSTVIKYNTRTAWTRMTSGVNVGGTNALAKQYVMLGGTLLNNSTARFGLGNSDKAYSNVSPSGQPYRLGIRPMPGITGVEVKSKTAYGSLSEATINFNAWDIKQLEDLELLYMRPGYTLLLEFGWVNGELTAANQPKFYDILEKSNINALDTFTEVYNQSAVNSGNYEALLGYVKNYGWSARPDGGYDCFTNIITIGEVLESLKVNYVPVDFSKNVIQNGILIPQLSSSLSISQLEIEEQYSKGLLPGLLYEMSKIIASDKSEGSATSNSVTIGSKTYQTYHKHWAYKDIASEGASKIKNLASANSMDTYMSLESFCDLLNLYILPKNANNTLFTKISTTDRTIGKTTGQFFANGTPIPVIVNDLTCLSHPLELSTNPDICLIRNDTWIKGNLQTNIQNSQNTVQRDSNIDPNVNTIMSFPTNAITVNSYLRFLYAQYLKTNTGMGDEILTSADTELRRQIENSIDSITTSGGNNTVIPVYNLSNGGQTFNTAVTQGGSQELGFNIFAFTNLTGNSLYNGIIQLFQADDQSNLNDQQYRSNFKSYFQASQNTSRVIGLLNSQLGFQIFQTPYGNQLARQYTQQTIQDTNNSSKQALQGLDNIQPFFVNQSGYLGNISNIYVNLDYIYSLATDKNIESKDRSGKNEVALIDFLQSMLRGIQSSLGAINNFDIHIDPKDNIARIIDINFTDDNGFAQDNNKMFQIEVHNLKSIVRNYRLESKIFPEQGTIIAISAQSPGPSGSSEYGYDNSTMLGFNNGVEDRLLPKKINNVEFKQQDLLGRVSTNFNKLHSYFDYLSGKTPGDRPFIPGSFDNVLRDLISAFNGTPNNPNKFKAIIPTQLSLDIDGIGGVIIGNVFQINQDIIPRGYKGDSGVGRKLGYLVKGLSHNIKDNDWVTTIDAYPVVIEAAPQNNIPWANLVSNGLNNDILSVTSGSVINITPNSGVAPNNQTSNFSQNNIKTAVQYFKSIGYSDEMTAGLLGNFLLESDLTPTAFNSAGGGHGALGIAQWRAGRQADLLKNKDPKTLLTQLQFVNTELTSGFKSSTYTPLRTSTTPQQAATIVFQKYEGAADTSLPKRIGYAVDIYSKIKAGVYA